MARDESFSNEHLAETNLVKPVKQIFQCPARSKTPWSPFPLRSLDAIAKTLPFSLSLSIASYGAAAACACLHGLTPSPRPLPYMPVVIVKAANNGVPSLLEWLVARNVVGRPILSPGRPILSIRRVCNYFRILNRAVDILPSLTQ